MFLRENGKNVKKESYIISDKILDFFEKKNAVRFNLAG